MLANLNRLASEGFGKSDDEITDEQREAQMILSLYDRGGISIQSIVWQIDYAYFRGVYNLSRYLLDKHPKLFAQIFNKHTQEYKEIFSFKFDDESLDFRVIEIFLGVFSKIIDETGKIKQAGAHGEIRTHDLKIRNFALYPAELRGRSENQQSDFHKFHK